MMIASARMYAWSPSLSAAWQGLLEWVSARAGVSMKVMDPSDPTPLDELWQRPDLGCAFMCGYPWALAADKPKLLAAPVPSPPRYGGRPVYFTDFIVSADGPCRTLADTFGGRIAFSIEHSHSGYNAPRFHLLRYRTPGRPTLYREVLGPFVRQLPCLDAVVEGRAEVAAIDGYGLELLQKHAPAVAGRVRVVESTIAAPSAPLVASPGVDEATCERLIAALVGADAAPEIRPTLDALLLARFAPVVPADFQVFLDRQQAAEAAGYPKLA
jgi:ABC-type phosphate/phosphonate transport system substrate-binding protein